MQLKHNPLKHGDRRTFPSFAIFPTVVEGKKIWLEWFMIEEEWTEAPEYDRYYWNVVRRWLPTK